MGDTGSTEQAENTEVEKANQDHHANQMNPNSKAYKDRMDNHADQLNPNNEKYQSSRQGQDDQTKPKEWRRAIDEFQLHQKLAVFLCVVQLPAI